MSPPLRLCDTFSRQGCTKGFHSDVKPVEPPKPKNEVSLSAAEEQIFSPQAPNRKIEPPKPRPPFDTPMVRDVR